MNRRDGLRLGALAVAGMAVASATRASEAVSVNAPMDSFWDVVKKRRSVRSFKPDPIPEEHLMKIVDAARMAPSAGNEQPWKFVIVTDRKLIEAMKNECIKRVESDLQKESALKGKAFADELDKRVDAWIRGRFSAPAYIVVLTDDSCQYPAYNRHNGPLAAGYLLLAARALGYGTVYMTDSIPVEVTRRVLNIPERYSQVCVTPVGIPTEWQRV